MTEDLAATQGAGPLLQRDYWTIFDDCALKPSEVIALVKEKFCTLPPAALVAFDAPHGLGLDSVVNILIRPSQRCAVRIIHQSAQSVTFGTLAGHPEAGRITFGAYRNANRSVIFHIRSRARSTNVLSRLGFLAVGDAVQTNTWTDFIRNTAALVGARIHDVIHADTTEVEELPEDDNPLQSPTFVAAGD